MKKILLLFLLMSFYPLVSTLRSDDVRDNKQAIISKLIDYDMMEKVHTNEWLDYANQRQSAKLNLIKKHHTQRFVLHRKKLEMVRDQSFSVQTLKRGLKMLLALRKKQAQDWKKFSLWSQQKARAIAAHQKKALREFEDSLD